MKKKYKNATLGRYNKKRIKQKVSNLNANSFVKFYTQGLVIQNYKKHGSVLNKKTIQVLSIKEPITFSIILIFFLD